MKNYEVINGINAINTFIKHEGEKNFLTRTGKFKLRRILHNLMDVYKIYLECLNEINEKYGLTEETNEDKVKEIQELLNIDTEIEIVKLVESDFTDECNFNDFMALDFAVE